MTHPMVSLFLCSGNDAARGEPRAQDGDEGVVRRKGVVRRIGIEKFVSNKYKGYLIHPPAKSIIIYWPPLTFDCLPPSGITHAADSIFSFNKNCLLRGYNKHVPLLLSIFFTLKMAANTIVVDHIGVFSQR